MNREAFRQRMQNLKSYREQNPGKGYLDWKASLPDNLQDDSSYNLQRAYELGYEPEYIEEDRSYHLPTRDSETGEILKKPWHPTFLIGLQEDAKLGYYPQTVDGTTYTTTWEGNENPIYKYADGGEVPPTNKPTIIEPIPYKGKLYSDRYGRKYTEEQVYDYYNNGTDEIDRFTGGPYTFILENYRLETEKDERSDRHGNDNATVSDTELQGWRDTHKEEEQRETNSNL